MSGGTILVLAAIVIVVLLALRSSLKHFQGEGGCCGGGSESIPETKELEGKKLGELVVHIEGMHCENCKNRVERAINRIDGAAAKVNLKKKVAVVSYDRELSEQEICQAVTAMDYQVTGIDR